MRILLVLLIALAPVSAGAFSFTTGGCATNGCETGDQLLGSNMTEIDTALDAVEAKNTTQDSSISTLNSNLGLYLPLSGGVMSASAVITLATGGGLVIPTGADLGPTGSGTIRATQMSSSGQIDDNDVAASAVDGGTGGEIQDETITGADILNDTVALITDTVGDFVATITSGDSYITLSGAGTEGRAVTISLASTVALDADVTTEIATKSAASSTNMAVPRFSGVSGDLQDSGVLIDNSNNVTIPGTLSAGGSSGASTIVMRNMADTGWVECGVNTTTWTCATDADGVADGTL